MTIYDINELKQKAIDYLHNIFTLSESIEEVGTATANITGFITALEKENKFMTMLEKENKKEVSDSE